MAYFSHRYLTTLGGKSLVVGRMPLASKKARSVFSQRRKVSGLTPAARASSIFVRDFISISHFYQLLWYVIFVKSSASLRYPFGRKRRRDEFYPRNRGDDLTTELHGTTQNQGYIYSVFPCSSVLVRGGCHFPCGASCSFVHFAEDIAIDGL